MFYVVAGRWRYLAAVSSAALRLGTTLFILSFQVCMDFLCVCVDLVPNVFLSFLFSGEC